MTNIMIAILCFSLAILDLCFSLAILDFVMAALDFTIPEKLAKFAGYFCVLAGIVCLFGSIVNIAIFIS